MNDNKIFIHAQASALSCARTALREGDSVFVRILSKSGPGRYLAYFSGSRFSVESSADFNPGQAFTAKISLRNGRLFLVPQYNPAASDHALVQHMNAVRSSVQTPQPLSDPFLASYFSSLGIQPDTITLRLVQLLEQMGVKFTAPFINKARRVAGKFSGREKEAAEAAMMLQEKGIAATAENVAQLLALFDGRAADENQDGRETAGGSKSAAAETHDDISLAVKKYFKTALEAAAGAPEGFVTLFNHLAYRSSDTDMVREHWVILPYELTSDTQRVTGAFRLQLDRERKTCKKIIISAEYSGKKAVFVVYLYTKTGRKVRFCIDPAPSDRGQEILTERLQSLLHSLNCFEREMKVEWSVSELSAGFAVYDKPVTVVRGKV